MASIFQLFDDEEDERKKQRIKQRRATTHEFALPVWVGSEHWAAVDEDEPEWGVDFEFSLTDTEAKVRACREALALGGRAGATRGVADCRNHAGPRRRGRHEPDV